MNDWAEIRRLSVAEGLSQRAIAGRLSLSRVTVARALASPTPPTYSRAATSSKFDEVAWTVRALLEDTPSMPASVLAERVGWEGSPSWFRKQVSKVRPETGPVDPADRLNYEPGDQTQCDLWFPPVSIPLGYGQTGSPPVLVMVSSFARYAAGIMLPTRTTGDLLAGMWNIIHSGFEAVPRRLLWDNEAGIGRRGTLAEGVTGFQGTLATKIVQLKPRDPESKGIVERMNGFLETSFLPGRSFESPEDFNTQMSDWLTTANQRVHARLKARPVDLFAKDRAAMLALPPVAPMVGHRFETRLGRDYYVRMTSNDYSVNPAFIGRMVTVSASLGQVMVKHGDNRITSHDRVWARGATITDPAHVEHARKLRHQFQQPRPVTPPVMVRNLADYDRLYGVDFVGERAS